MLTALKKKIVWGWALILVVSLYGLLGGGQWLEWGAYRFGELLAPHRASNPQVVVVSIDDAALQKYGPWPWPRRFLAALVDQLTDAKAQVIVLSGDFSAPQNSDALNYVAQLKALAANDPNAMTSGLSAKLDEAQGVLANDNVLAASLLRSGRVLLSAPGYRASESPTAQNDGTDWSFALPLDASTSPPVSMHAPFGLLTQVTHGVGYLDENSASPVELPLLVQAGGHAVASLPLLVAARQLGVENSAIHAGNWGGLTVGDWSIVTDRHLQVLLHAGGNEAAPPTHGFADVVAGRVPAEHFAGKAVIVGRAPQVTNAAMAVSSLLNGDFAAAPYWVWGLRALFTLLVGVYLVFALPRLGFGVGLGVSIFLVIALLNGEYVPLLSKSLWLPLMLPLAYLLLGHGGSLVWQFIRERSGVSRGSLSEANRELGQAMQSLGRYDQALARFRLCLPSRLLYDNLSALGQEHERGRRYSQAIEVYDYILRLAPGFGDIAARLEHLRQLESTPTLARTGASGNLSRAITSGGLQKPMLGRYELLKELGRGAMGVVYLGKDAKINRQVAIKTMALAEEFEGETLKDVHDRFFREAETAGRLNHPNIVTIYDVGEDQGLAYIAMDYLAGEPMQKYASSANLLPMNEVIAIIIKISEALDYAHKQKVVHRDIKPANIMYERDTGRIKLTDFGVAALTDLSKTKTGTILGSPLFMSPEQVAGKKLDGRSDLFSLGVTLYQLLRGELPFEAPSLTGLMFKIANEPAPDVTFLRPDIPPTVKVVVDRALQKDPDQRFQTGAEMANSLRLCLGVRKRSV
jgi:CHASE2 domain-containing sensor protein